MTPNGSIVSATRLDRFRSLAGSLKDMDHICFVLSVAALAAFLFGRCILRREEVKFAFYAQKTWHVVLCPLGKSDSLSFGANDLHFRSSLFLHSCNHFYQHIPNMAEKHPLAAQNAVYHNNYKRITEKFEALVTQEDADELLVEVDSALADPYLPRQFRSEYNVMRAMYGGEDAAVYVAAAEKAVQSVVEVYRAEGRSEETIKKDLEGVNEAIQAFKDGLSERTRRCMWTHINQAH
jgi:hypothetical protein